jgi:hypothetical protein
MPPAVSRLLRLYSRLQWLERVERRRPSPDPERLSKLQRLQARMVRRIALGCLVA